MNPTLDGNHIDTGSCARGTAKSYTGKKTTVSLSIPVDIAVGTSEHTLAWHPCLKWTDTINPKDSRDLLTEQDKVSANAHSSTWPVAYWAQFSPYGTKMCSSTERDYCIVFCFLIWCPYGVNEFFLWCSEFWGIMYGFYGFRKVNSLRIL